MPATTPTTVSSGQPSTDTTVKRTVCAQSGPLTMAAGASVGGVVVGSTGSDTDTGGMVSSGRRASRTRRAPPTHPLVLVGPAVDEDDDATDAAGA
jgi:hypothetical protein